MKILNRFIVFLLLLFSVSAFAYAQTDEIQIERLYATTTAGSHSVNNLFDEDLRSYWATEAGAGLNEGIMLYFDKPYYLESMSVYPAQGNEFAEISSFTIYADGQELTQRRTKKGNEHTDIKINKELTALFIRINMLDRSFIETETWSEEDEEFSEGSMLKIQKQAFQVGISELIFFNDMGPIPVNMPETISASVKSSSSLKPKTAYGSFRLFDGQTTMAWSEGAQGNGIHEHISISAKESFPVTEIKIWNGYQRSEKHFKDNARVKTLLIGSSKAEAKPYHLEDKMGAQTLILEQPLTTSQLYFEILEVYEGIKYQDLVISEIQLFKGKQALQLLTEEAEQIDDIIKSQTKGSPLALILNRNIDYEYEDVIGDLRITKSILLRSNGTFVYYEEYHLYNDGTIDQQNVLADGNWTVVSTDDNSSVIRIFGKHRKLSRHFVPYKGEDNSDFLRVFQDYLTVTAEVIKGQRFIEKIPVRKPTKI